MARATLASNVGKVYASILFVCPSGREKGKLKPFINKERQALGGFGRGIASSREPSYFVT
jgi:hypothetical protein